MVCNASSHSSTTNYNAHGEDQFDSGGKTRKKFKKRCFTIFITIFSIVVVLCVAAAFAVILTQKPVDFEDVNGYTYGESAQNGSLQLSPHKASHRRFPGPIQDSVRPSMDDIINGPQPISEYFAMWLGDDTLIMKGSGEGYVKIDTNNPHTIISEAEEFIRGDQLGGKDGSMLAKLNSDAKYAVIAKGISQIYRYSNKALYEMAEVKNGFLRNHVPIGPYSSGNEPLQLFEFNPAPGSIDFIFVYENNIYYQADPYARASAIPITSNGAQFRYYGIADWLYEEEIFSGSKAIWWSKSGNYLAYAMFDDRNVTKVSVPHYNPHLLYPTYDQVPYPKAGAQNQPAAFLWMWHKGSNSSQMILPPDELFRSGSDPFGSYYVFSTDWITLEKDGRDQEYLVVVWANRNQDYVIISICRYGQQCKTHLRLKFTVREMQMWAEPQDFKIKFFSKSGFFFILPKEHTDGNVYNHVAHIAVTKESKYHPISGYHGGSYDVNEIVGYDKERDEIFFESRGGTLGEMHLYRVPHASESDASAPQCISCYLRNCKWTKTNFASSGKQFLLFCSSPYKNAETYLKKTKNILDNYVIKDGVPPFHPSYDVPEIKQEIVKMVSGLEAHVKLMVPPKFNPKLTYPVLLHLYAGPNTALVNYQTPSSMLTYFAASRQYVVINVDGRGSAHRGWKMRQPMYKRFGGPEVDDQIEVIRLLLKRYPFLDSERVASFGWSYGGFASAHIAARDAGTTFKCAVSVAPVTDFRFYDSAYTERYMLQPNENAQGYDAGSLLNKTLVDNFKNVKFMLAHGEADDNVHYQNSALLSKALQEANIHFTQLVYTNQDHSISQTFMHLMSEIDRFLNDDCFKLSYY